MTVIHLYKYSIDNDDNSNNNNKYSHINGAISNWLDIPPEYTQKKVFILLHSFLERPAVLIRLLLCSFNIHK